MHSPTVVILLFAGAAFLKFLALALARKEPESRVGWAMWLAAGIVLAAFSGFVECTLDAVERERESVEFEKEQVARERESLEKVRRLKVRDRGVAANRAALALAKLADHGCGLSPQQVIEIERKLEAELKMYDSTWARLLITDKDIPSRMLERDRPWGDEPCKGLRIYGEVTIEHTNDGYDIDVDFVDLKLDMKLREVPLYRGTKVRICYPYRGKPGGGVYTPSAPPRSRSFRESLDTKRHRILLKCNYEERNTN